MATHIVGLHRPAQIRLSGVVSFRGTRERDAATPPETRGEDRYELSRICCQRGGTMRTGADCQACPRFLGFAEDPAGLRVRCAWTDRDRVRDCMTLAGALVVTRPHATCREAERLMQRHQLEHLLVIDGMWLAGVVSRRDLRGGGWVADRMAREIFAVFGDATLGEALAAMTALDVGMLPVIGERFVIGVITRGDLARVGAPPLACGGSAG